MFSCAAARPELDTELKFAAFEMYRRVVRADSCLLLFTIAKCSLISVLVFLKTEEFCVPVTVVSLQITFIPTDSAVNSVE